MRKTVTVKRTLLVDIALTGDAERDAIALENSMGSDSQGLFPFVSNISVLVRDMVCVDHDAKIFYNGSEGVFSHSLLGNHLSIYEENITLEDC